MPLVTEGIIAGAGSLLSGAASVFGNRANQRAAAAQNAPFLAAIQAGENIANQPFQPYQGQLTPPPATATIQAQSLAGQTAQEAARYRAAAATPFSGATLQQYENPYTQNVINPTLQNLTTAYDTNLANLTRKAAMTDAFGYGRTAAMSSPLTQQYLQDYGNIEEAGLGKAFGAAESEFNTQQSAFERLAQEAGSPASSGVGALTEAGQAFFGQEEAADKAQYQEFLRGQNWSRDQFQPYLNALNAAKGSLVQPAYTNPLSAAIGGGLSALGTAGALGAFGSGNTSGLTSSIQGTLGGIENTWSPLSSADYDFGQASSFQDVAGQGGGSNFNFTSGGLADLDEGYQQPAALGH